MMKYIILVKQVVFSVKKLYLSSRLAFQMCIFDLVNFTEEIYWRLWEVTTRVINISQISQKKQAYRPQRNLFRREVVPHSWSGGNTHVLATEGVPQSWWGKVPQSWLGVP